MNKEGAGNREDENTLYHADYRNKKIIVLEIFSKMYYIYVKYRKLYV
jgi:hypothetical protein